jgi:uncharacterized membrane protein
VKVSPFFDAGLRMWPYRKRLVQDLARGRANGWVTAEGEREITAELAAKGEFKLAAALGILASVLFGFAAISFVAAHWQEMPRLMRLGLLLALIWAGYGVAGLLAERGVRLFSDAAVLFAVAIFGASIMLISQMYHIDGNPPDAVLLWWLGALLSGVALRSNPALTLALILVCVWSYMEASQSGQVHWAFLLGWGVVTAAIVWQSWRPGLHLSALALSLFVISLGFTLGDGHQHGLVAALGLVTVVGGVAAEKLLAEADSFAAPAVGYGLAVAFTGLFALQFFEDTAYGTVVLLAAMTLLLLLAAIAYGLNAHHRGALWLGYIGFSIEILALYWKTVGSILGNSVFFLSAGLIVAALAFVAWRLARRQDAAGAAP